MHRLRLLLLMLAGLVGLGLAFAAVTLVAAQRAIEALDPPLPPAARLLASRAARDLPVRLSWIDTASQAMPRSAVLEPRADPSPDASYVMSHPVFVLEWADGRILLVDLGMDPESARRFGRLIRLLSGGEPIEPHGSAAEALGNAVSRVAGVVLTHLHSDHTAGAAALCAALERTVPLFQAPLQAERGNFTTRGGRAEIEAAGCLKARPLEGESPFAVPGFPGLVVSPVAGHTPGSQVFVVHVRSGGEPVRSFVLTGDVVNHGDALLHDLPKPRLYSLLVVPEARERLGVVRRHLRGLVEEHRLTPLVSHDRGQLEASGVPQWLPPAAVGSRANPRRSHAGR